MVKSIFFYQVYRCTGIRSHNKHSHNKLSCCADGCKEKTNILELSLREGFKFKSFVFIKDIFSIETCWLRFDCVLYREMYGFDFMLAYILIKCYIFVFVAYKLRSQHTLLTGLWLFVFPRL